MAHVRTTCETVNAVVHAFTARYGSPAHLDAAGAGDYMHALAQGAVIPLDFDESGFCTRYMAARRGRIILRSYDEQGRNTDEILLAKQAARIIGLVSGYEELLAGLGC